MLSIFNSLTNKKEIFTPLAKDKITLYVCGITPYDTTHLGHAFTYISFDILVRLLKHKGYKVEYTQNVTDINDRDNDILKKAKEQNTSWEKLADFWTNRFLTDMKALNWVMPTNYVYASKQIPQMISLIEKIIQNGFGYVVNGSVYLDVSKDKDFGKLSKFTPEQMLKTAKEFEEGVGNVEKKHPLDITLWRAKSDNEPPHIPSFASPWSKGRPGWHIECSAMSMSSLGETIDIHGGGNDLIYPHHEAEIAQSKAATGKKFVNYWIHTGTVYKGGQKMSKSLGNLVLVADLLKKYSPNAIRFMLLSHHYRDQWEYNEKELVEAEEIIKALKHKAISTRDSGITALSRMTEILEDDLNTPKILKELKNSKEDVTLILNLLGFSL